MNKKSLKTIEKLLKNHWKKWTILAILAIIIYIGFLFYSYIYKPIYQPKDLVPEKLEIDKETYQELINYYNSKQENINRIISKEYPNIFK